MSQRNDHDAADLPSHEIGPAVEADLPGTVEILNETIMSSYATFATRSTSVAEQREWFGQFAATGPYRLLVARSGGRVVGFAASLPYRDHEAFRQTAEVSIALDRRHRGQGLGTKLYGALFDRLAGEPLHVLLAGIALPNDASVALHRRFGFTDVGTFNEYAVKNGRYISSLWMQRRMSG